MRAIERWWFSGVPKARVAWLRTFLYLFVFVDVFLTTSWVARHANVPGELYQPLLIGRLLPLPTPGPVTVLVVEVLLLVGAAVGATGRFHRLAGWLVFFMYLEWMIIAFSYGKVDHDRVGFLVALAVLPTAGAARWGDQEESEAAGFAVHSIQLAAVLTYFLAAFAKLRFGGIGWVNGATLVRAVIRRGTGLAEPLLDHPWILHVTQYLVVGFELLSPVLLIRGRIGMTMLAAALVFHAITFSTISIIFLPHIMCLLAFLPLERLSSSSRTAEVGSAVA
ncbi:MAG: HTTM domain-containing protein [Actinobacteria bacterium]|nr:HTTM domain-containing protein [Actinomycetota bacterium]